MEAEEMGRGGMVLSAGGWSTAGYAWVDYAAQASLGGGRGEVEERSGREDRMQESHEMR